MNPDELQEPCGFCGELRPVGAFSADVVQLLCGSVAVATPCSAR